LIECDFLLIKYVLLLSKFLFKFYSSLIFKKQFDNNNKIQKLWIYQNYHLLGQPSSLFTPLASKPNPLSLLTLPIHPHTPKSSGSSNSLSSQKFSYIQQTNTQQHHPPVPAKSNLVPARTIPRLVRKQGMSPDKTKKERDT